MSPEYSPQRAGSSVQSMSAAGWNGTESSSLSHVTTVTGLTAITGFGTGFTTGFTNFVAPSLACSSTVVEVMVGLLTPVALPLSLPCSVAVLSTAVTSQLSLAPWVVSLRSSAFLVRTGILVVLLFLTGLLAWMVALSLTVPLPLTSLSSLAMVALSLTVPLPLTSPSSLAMVALSLTVPLPLTSLSSLAMVALSLSVPLPLTSLSSLAVSLAFPLPLTAVLSSPKFTSVFLAFPLVLPLSFPCLLCKLLRLERVDLVRVLGSILTAAVCFRRLYGHWSSSVVAESV